MAHPDNVVVDKELKQVRYVSLVGLEAMVHDRARPEHLHEACDLPWIEQGDFDEQLFFGRVPVEREGLDEGNFVHVLLRLRGNAVPTVRLRAPVQGRVHGHQQRPQEPVAIQQFKMLFQVARETQEKVREHAVHVHHGPLLAWRWTKDANYGNALDRARARAMEWKHA